GPAKSNGGQERVAVVEGKAQVVRADASRAHGACVAHSEHRRRIPRPTGLEVAHEALEVGAHLVERELEIDALAWRQVRRGEQLSCDGEERRAKAIEAIAADRKARGHRVPAVFLE